MEYPTNFFLINHTQSINLCEMQGASARKNERDERDWAIYENLWDI